MTQTVVVAIFCVVFLSLIYALFTMNKMFLSQEGAFHVLSDRKYLNTFSSTDLRVRNVDTINNYIEKKIATSVVSFTLHEKIRLMYLSVYVDWLVFSRVEEKTYFVPKKFTKMPWKFGLVEGRNYEEGLSHTRNGVIILSRDTLKVSSNMSLCKTLLHEKVHVYQYFYPRHVQRYILYKGLIPIRKKTEKQRANPDIDDMIYANMSGLEFTANYKANAKSILDVYYSQAHSTSQFYEHPYESMSIELTNLLFDE